MPVATSLHNLRGVVQSDENRTKEEFMRSGGMINWQVNFGSNLKSRTTCVVGKESLPNYILKKIDICNPLDPKITYKIYSTRYNC